MSAWDDAAASALLGTRRRAALPPSLLTAPGPLAPAAEHLAALAAQDPARALLDAAAVLAPWRRAGRAPALADAPDDQQPAPTPTGPDEGSALAPAAVARLELLLASPRNDEVTALLREWLEAAAQHGRRLPAEHLPRLLTDAARDTALAASLAPALGARGRWLAALRPDWQRVAGRHAQAPGGPTDTSPEAAARTWGTGSAAERRLLLAALRAVDPAAGTALLAGTWAKESGADREALLPLLADGAGPWDEALLEKALRDRREAVRTQASRLLLHIPGTALRERWTARARAAVRAERHLLRWRIVVVPPEPLTADELRELGGLGGLGGQRRPQGTGERAWALEQVVAAAPLDTWTSASGRSPEQLVSAPVDDDWRDPLHRGWVTAASRQGDAEWARALLGSGESSGVVARTPPQQVARLVALLPPDEAGAVAARLLRGSARTSSTVQLVLDAVPTPWPAVLLDAVLDRLARPVEGAAWADRSLAATAALRLAAGAGAAAARRLGDPDPTSPPGHLLRVLSFRHAMLEELR